MVIFETHGSNQNPSLDIFSATFIYMGYDDIYACCYENRKHHRVSVEDIFG